FEDGDTTDRERTPRYGEWAQDLTEVVGAENGILPADGARMLRMVATAPAGAGGGGSEAVQFVDVSAFSTMIDSGQVKFRTAVKVNRVPGDATTDRLFNIYVECRASTAANFGSSPA